MYKPSEARYQALTFKQYLADVRNCCSCISAPWRPRGSRLSSGQLGDNRHTSDQAGSPQRERLQQLPVSLRGDRACSKSEGNRGSFMMRLISHWVRPYPPAILGPLLLLLLFGSFFYRSAASWPSLFLGKGAASASSLQRPLKFLSRICPLNAAQRAHKQVGALQAREGGPVGATGPSSGEFPSENSFAPTSRPRMPQPLLAHQGETLESLYTLAQRHQQQQRPPADDSVLQQLLCPGTKEEYFAALRQIGRSAYLTHLLRPVVPLDLRPWLQQELKQEEKNLAQVCERLQEQQQNQQDQHQRKSLSSNSNSSRAQKLQLQQLRDKRIALLHQVQYLKEKLHALNVLMLERQPPKLLLQLLRAAAVVASRSEHREPGFGAAVRAVAAAASGSAAAASDPISATVAATEAADFPLTVLPAPVTQQQQSQLRRLGIIPQWLLGKGLGVLGRPAGLSGQQSELAAFVSAGWAEDFPPLQQLPTDTPGDAAARKLNAAVVRLFGGAGSNESPLEYKLRMQELLEQPQPQQQQLALPGMPAAAAAAAALQLQQEARAAQLPPSVLQLLSRYAHQRPHAMSLTGTVAENAELARKAAAELQQLFLRLASGAAAAAASEQTEKAPLQPSVTRQIGGAEKHPVQAWIEGYFGELRKREQERKLQVMETAAHIAERKLAQLKSGSGTRSSSSGNKRRSFLWRRREEREAIEQSIEEARILHSVERYLALLRHTEGDPSASSTPGRAHLAPHLLQENAGVLGTSLHLKDGESLEARERRVSDFVQKASAELFERAAECLGSWAVTSGGRVFPGMLVKGRVVRVTRQAAVLDIGVGCDACLLSKDVFLPLERQSSAGLRQVIKEGDSLYCVVSKASPNELRVSLLPLRQLAAWEVLMEATETQQTLVAIKQQALPGGLVVRVLGIQGFLPASHLCDPSLLQPPQQPQQHQQPLIVQVLQADVSRRRLLVSQRLPMSRSELTLRKVAPGDLVSGCIVEVHPFGCVVQFGASRALLHASEISHCTVDPALVFHVGKHVRALVKSYHPATGKVGLSTKALERYPGQILTEMQKVFDEAHAAAARYKEQQRELHKLQEAATQQLMRSLGMTINQTSDSREPPQESALQESRPSLWWGLNSESKLLRFLEQQLQQRKKKEALSSVLAEGAVAEPTKKEEETETEKLVHLPGGGAVLVRARRSTNQVDEEVLAAAAAEALELKMAMMQSRIPLSSNWQVPKITEGPLEDEQWDFL